MINYLTLGFGLIIASYVSIISIANPFSTLPVFISLTEYDTNEERNATAKKTAFYVFLILALFLLTGSYIKSFFGISLAGIRVAGGFIIFRSAWSMLTPGSDDEISDEEKESARSKNDISFSPLALPMLSGPGSIAVVIGLASQAKGNVIDYIFILIAILLCALTVYFIFRIAPFITKHVSPTGMSAFTRLMGFIVMAIAVQFILSGIQEFYMF